MYLAAAVFQIDLVGLYNYFAVNIETNETNFFLSNYIIWTSILQLYWSQLERVRQICSFIATLARLRRRATRKWQTAYMNPNGTSIPLNSKSISSSWFRICKRRFITTVLAFPIWNWRNSAMWVAWFISIFYVFWRMHWYRYANNRLIVLFCRWFERRTNFISCWKLWIAVESVFCWSACLAVESTHSRFSWFCAII